MTRRGENDSKGGKSGHSGSRDERLKAALRENLRRRKAQERARSAAPAPEARPKPVPPPRDDKSC